MPRFIPFKKKDIEDLLSVRLGEVKLGERCVLLSGDNLKEELAESDALFVIIGLPEDIGVRANHGLGGARTAWPAFLKSFLNIQETSGLSGLQFILLGQLQIEDELTDEKVSIERLRDLTADIDDIVFPLIEMIVASGKIPLIIGGGHNNAYPILKGASLALKSSLNVLNMDAHTDYRRMEGRHSGNGFRYARENGYLKHYAVIGLHEGYNQQEIINTFDQDPGLIGVFWEDIFLRKTLSWDSALTQCLGHIDEDSFGVELDLDAIENVLTSAASPVGVSATMAMSLAYDGGKHQNAVYCHIAEGVVHRSDGLSGPFTGKLLNYLVQAFCKGVLER